MRALRLSVRARLTALYAALFLGAGALLLGLSLWLVDRHLERTLPAGAADAALADLRGQYVLALAGATLVAVALGWVVAGRVLAPLARITATARRVSQDRLDERIALAGPRDELRELADTFDGMLDGLAAAFASQRRFVANASHELRTPLTVVRAEIDVTLADPDATAAQLRAMGETARDATCEAEALLESLLVLARSEAGLRRRDAVDLAAVVHQAVDAAATEARLREVDVRVDAGAPVVVDGDAQLLGRLAGNLVENAVRHNLPGGWATVEVAAVDAEARLLVRSSGAPVSEAVAGRLVEPFQRGDGRAGAAPGAGLGLSIVRAVAEAHGGRVELEPRAGGGLCVAARLPLSTRPAATAAGAGALGSRRPTGARR